MNKDTPDQLYKYFHDDRTDVLENEIIRYTQPEEFNDPFEVLPYIKSVADADAIDNKANEIWDDPKIFDEALAKNLAEHPKFKLLSKSQRDFFTLLAKNKMNQMIPSLRPQMQSFFKDAMKFEGQPGKFMRQTIVGAINNAIGILCLTETYENLLMWSHYSNSHKGFVVGFDKNHPYFQQTSDKAGLAGYVKKVRYTIDRPEMIIFDTKKTKEENLENWVKNLIWVKSHVWEYENEWRVVNHLSGADSEVNINGTKIFLFNFPLEAIKTIYLGCKMESKKKEEILSLVNSKENLKNVAIHKSTIHEKQYKLNFEIIN